MHGEIWANGVTILGLTFLLLFFFSSFLPSFLPFLLLSLPTGVTRDLSESLFAVTEKVVNGIDRGTNKSRSLSYPFENNWATIISSKKEKRSAVERERSVIFIRIIHPPREMAKTFIPQWVSRWNTIVPSRPPFPVIKYTRNGNTC